MLLRKKIKKIDKKDTAFFDNVQVFDNNGNEIMDYDNEIVKVSEMQLTLQEIVLKLGPFDFGVQPEEYSEEALEFRYMFQQHTKEKYEGEW